MKPAALPHCQRSPLADLRQRPADDTPSSAHLRHAAQLIVVAYPGTTLHEDREGGRTYVANQGHAYLVDVHFSRDDASGYAALVLTYPSCDEAALDGARELNGGSCRSPAELVVARWPDDGQPTVRARGLLDEEAVAVDVRTLALRDDFEGARVQLLYFAYYAGAGWMGHVGFRSDVAIRGKGLFPSRLPASYLKRSRQEPERQEGALGPKGSAPGILQLMVAAFDSANADDYAQIDVPIDANGWVSGMDILRRIPGGSIDGNPAVPGGESPSNDAPPSLIGCWRKERVVGADDDMHTEMDFISATEMDYGVELGGKWMVFRMTHRMEGETLVLKATPATPEERWRLRFESGAMILESKGTRVWLRRGERRAPRTNPHP